MVHSGDIDTATAPSNNNIAGVKIHRDSPAGLEALAVELLSKDA
jgi:hypothetical protein